MKSQTVSQLTVKQDCRKIAELLFKMQLINGVQGTTLLKTQWLPWSAIAELTAILGNISNMKNLILICGLLGSTLCHSQIDTSIYLKQMELQQRQQAQNNQNMGQLRANLGGILLNKRINQMRQLGTIEEKRAFAHKSIYSRHLIRVLNNDIAEENAQKLATLRHEAEIASINAQTEKINAETQLILTKSLEPPKMEHPKSSGGEKKVYIERISDDLYKTDEGQLIKTQSCYEYVYSEKALIIKNKLIFRNGRTCTIDNVIDM